MRRAILFVIWAIAGCDTPGPEFRAVEATRITIGESRFDVRVKGPRAEAIRLTPDFGPHLAGHALRAVAAIEKVSGCHVRQLDGDAAVIRAALDCGGRLPPLPKSVEFECSLDVIYDSFADMTCESLSRM